MADAASSKFLSQADFARRRGVSRKSVTLWKSKGLIVLNDAGQVDVDASEWKLDDRPSVYRGGVAHRPIRGPDQNNHDPRGNGSKPKASPPKRDAPPLQNSVARPSDGAPDPLDFDLNDPNLTQAEAVRRKENFLGLLRKHEFEVANREWVRVEDVGKAVEREYAVVRERLLAIPGKLAAKLVDRDRVEIELALFEEISEALNELHAPDPDDGLGGASR